MSWNRGDRVVRRVYLDDGTWEREGDACLPRSPLKHGTVLTLIPRWRLKGAHYEVKWDSGEVGRYLEHGLRREEQTPVTNITISKLPYQDHPFVHGSSDGKDVWLKRDGTWTEEDGHPEAAIPLHGDLEIIDPSEQNWERNEHD